MGKVDVHDTGRGERVDTSAGFPADLAGSGGRFVSSDDPGVQAVAGASGKDWGTDETEVKLDGNEAYLLGFGSIPATTRWIDAGHHDYFPDGAAFLCSVIRTARHFPFRDDYHRGRADAALSALGL